MVQRLIQFCIVLCVILALVSVGTFAYILSFYSSVGTSQYDCAVVFGAAVWPGGAPSHALSDRTHAAIDAYDRGQVSCLVFSGADSAYGTHEVDAMIEIAYEREVELEDLVLDYKGYNTRETIHNLDSNHSYLLVSNDFHLARINLFAHEASLDFEVHRSVYQHGRYSREPFFVLREAVAIWYYAFI